jgi:hypothetical protein
MIGSNTLILNEATMKEAIQFWLNSVVVGKAPRVTNVKQHNADYCSFEIKIESEFED